MDLELDLYKPTASNSNLLSTIATLRNRIKVITNSPLDQVGTFLDLVHTQKSKHLKM